MLARAHKPLSWDRSAVLLGVIGLHVGGIYLVSVYGGFTALVEKTATALTLVHLAPDPPRPPIEPARIPVQLQQVQHIEPLLPDPLPFAPEGVSRDDAITVVTTGGSAEAGVEVTRVPAVAPTPLTYRSRRPTDDFYPPVSIRMAEEGAAVVRVCVGAGGDLRGIPQVERSSGHARLDAAAVEWAREALTFMPATENGTPVASCKAFRVRFALR
jgi:TonB family protein